MPGKLGLIVSAELAVEVADQARAKRMDLELEPRKATARQSALERYLARGEVSAQQYRDGERLLRDWLLSGLEPQITGAYEAAFLGAAMPLVPGLGPGWSFYAAAMRAVGLILSPVLAHVVLHGCSASSWAEETHRPRSDGIAALRLALDALGAHYRGRRCHDSVA